LCACLKLVPPGVDLALFLFLDVVQPVLLMKEKLAAFGTLDWVALVGVPGVRHKLVIASKVGVAFFTLVFFAYVKDVHDQGADKWNSLR